MDQNNRLYGLRVDVFYNTATVSLDAYEAPQFVRIHLFFKIGELQHDTLRLSPKIAICQPSTKNMHACALGRNVREHYDILFKESGQLFIIKFMF